MSAIPKKLALLDKKVHKILIHNHNKFYLNLPSSFRLICIHHTRERTKTKKKKQTKLKNYMYSFIIWINKRYYFFNYIPTCDHAHFWYWDVVTDVKTFNRIKNSIFSRRTLVRIYILEEISYFFKIKPRLRIISQGTFQSWKNYLWISTFYFLWFL